MYPDSRGRLMPKPRQTKVLMFLCGDRINNTSGKGRQMAENRSHKTAARRIAKKYATEYNEGEGVDIKSERATIEVETPETVGDAPGQLRGHRGPAFIAGSNKEAVDKALELTKGTTIGVMDSRGNVIRRSTRKK